MKLATAGLVLLACSAASGQYVRTPATRITPQTGQNMPALTEPAIVASPLNSNDVLVGFNTGGTPGVCIAISLDGGLTFTAPGVVPPPAGCDNTLGVDPTVGASFVTGDLYMGASNQITVTCITLSDITSDGAVNLEDAIAFESAYAAGAAPADVNHDAAVDALDAVLFLDDYAAHQPP
jgi:hypothetical protein